MDEAKTLVNMSVNAIFGAMLLGAISVILACSYFMWSAFSKQDMANERMSYYSNLTAFDNVSLRGSEVLSLLETADDMDIFVVFGTASGSTSLDNCSNVSPLDYCYINPNKASTYIFAQNDSYAHNTPVCRAGIYMAQSRIGANNVPTWGSKNLYGLSHSQLLEIFMNDSKLGTADSNGNPSFAMFKSALLYANDGTTDVVGVVIMKAGSGVTDFGL